MPIWEDVHKQAESKMRSIIHTTTGWEVQYAKNGIEIAILKVSDSDFVMIRSDLVLPLPSATVHRLYIVRLPSRVAHALSPAGAAGRRQLEAVGARHILLGGGEGVREP